MDKTFLTVKELSAKLGVSEKTVYRMINAKSIPFAIKIGGQWRFNSEKIEKWIIGSQQRETGQRPADQQICISTALSNGLIIYRAHGENRDEILDEILNMNSHLPTEEITSIKKNILYQESIISSSLQGLSFMVPEVEESYAAETSKLLLAFLERPMDFKAIDGTATQIVLLLLAANKTERLILKTRLQRLFMEKSFLDLLKQQPHRRELLEKITQLETTLLS